MPIIAPFPIEMPDFIKQLLPIQTSLPINVVFEELNSLLEKFFFNIFFPLWKTGDVETQSIECWAPPIIQLSAIEQKLPIEQLITVQLLPTLVYLLIVVFTIWAPEHTLEVLFILLNGYQAEEKLVL